MATNDKIKFFQMGTGVLVKPVPENLVIPLLEPCLNASKCKDFRVAFFGVSPDKELPTRLILGWETDREFDVWHIVIYWQDVYDASIEATWSPIDKDLVVTMKLGLLEAIN